MPPQMKDVDRAIAKLVRLWVAPVQVGILNDQQAQLIADRVERVVFHVYVDPDRVAPCRPDCLQVTAVSLW